MTRLFVAVCALLLSWAGPGCAESLKIGILAYRGDQSLKAKWQSLAAYLDAAVPEHRFEIVPITLTSADEQIRSGKLSFLVTNPGQFSRLDRIYPMSVLASRLQMKSDGSYAETFGSAVIARRDSGITVLQDVRGKSVLAVGRNAFGGFQVAWKTFQDAGIDLFSDTDRLTFVGFPMDQIVDGVLSGEADVGVVRSGLLETLAREGRIDPKTLVILNSSASYTHPDGVSSVLYPEWPFAALPSTPLELRNKVAIALLSSGESPLAQLNGMVDRWTAPLSYNSARRLTDLYYAGLEDRESDRRTMFLLAAAVAAGGAALGVLLIRGRRHRPSGGPDTSDSPGEVEFPLTPRESEILKLIADGLSTKEIARSLKISPKTVEFHRSNLFRKFGARTSGQLVAKASRGIPLVEATVP